ncbi:hypothetical protein FM071_04700 [Sulfurimonas paralvinellae]|uniref:Uncharacterized protein n=2 Tax=Sulfurimonas paralvinellae TaxID=317658 RepID=A0A7M1BD33_9BACT|nr:hypothetical protein FM071_04700 [Sulfurimonas paralvinellae]
MNNRQRLFVRYIIAVLIDLTVLNFFTEYFPEYLHLETFSLSLLAAILLQTLLQLTLKVEHKVAQRFFAGKSGIKVNILRGISAWSIIFISKLVMLEALSIIFGDAVHFGGPIHGVIAFIATIAAMIIAEQILLKIYNALGNK